MPNLLSLGAVLKVMQNLLSEGIPIRDVRTIAEALAEGALKSQDPDALTGGVRMALSRTIYQQINGLEDELEVLSLEPQLEQMLQDTLRGQQTSVGLNPVWLNKCCSRSAKGWPEWRVKVSPLCCWLQQPYGLGLQV